MSGKAIRESLGFLAVVASMVLVGLEIRQNTTVARAATRLAPDVRKNTTPNIERHATVLCG